MKKFNLLAKTLLVAVCLLLRANSAWAEFKDFSVIVNNQTGTLLTNAELVQNTAVSFGVAVDGEGAVSRVAVDDASSVATISGTYHSDHGCTGLQVVVPVSGSVKITVGQCTYSSNTITVKNSSNETVASKTPSSPACWKNSRSNVDELFYSGGATTLTISGMGYCPYIAVEAVSVAPSEYNITYSLGSESATGILPVSAVVTDGDTYTLPKNFTLYKEGYTLTGWNDGTNTYTPGQVVTPTDDMIFTPVFSSNNGVTLADANKNVIVKWDFQRNNGAPLLNYSANQTGIYVTQASVNGTTIDVKLDFDTKSSGKIANGNWGDWCQMNDGTTFTIPSAKDAVVEVEAYNALSTLTIDGSSDYTSGKVVNKVITSTTSTIDVVISGEGSYYRYVQLTYPGSSDPWANFDNFAMDFRNGAYITSSETSSTTIGFKKSGENIVRTTADDEDAIGTITAKFHSNDHGLQNFSMSVAVPGYVKISAGTCAWGGNLTITGTNSFSHTVNTNTGNCYHSNTSANKVYAYYTTNEGTTLTIAGGNYMPYIAVESVDFYTITGTISGGDIDGTNVILTSQLTGQEFSATVSSNGFTVDVPADTYDISLSSTENYVISTPTEVTVTAAAPLTINVISSAPQTVSGDIANAPTTDFTLTFTGTGANVVNLNCLANATSFTTSLTPDTYTMSCADATLSTLSQESFTVVNSAITHNIYFPEVAIPAATQQNITVDNTIVTETANNYKSVTNALAAAKAGSISSPIITLTSGQTYREQVIVDMANVTLKTSGEGKATITWYYGIGYGYYSLNSSGYYDKDRAMTRNSKLAVGPARWGATMLVKSTGTGFKAENIIFENSFNQYYTTEEVADGVEANQVGDATITYDRTLQSGDDGYKAADSRAVTERAAAIGFENNPTGIQLYNCEFRGSQDTFYTSGKIHVKKCNIMGNTDYIFGGGDVVFDDCDLTIGGYSDSENTAYITANNPTEGQYYIFRDCTVKASNRTYVKANLGRDWGGTKAGVYFFNLKNEIDNKLEYKWSNMGGAITAGTAHLHIYDFDPTVNANYNTTGSNGANVNGTVSDDDATTLYTGVVTRLGFTPAHIYDIALDENSYYNSIRIKAANSGTGDVKLTRGISADKWSTIVLPFAMDATQVTTTFGSGVKVAELTSGDASNLNFTTVTAMEANKPYAIKVASNFTTATISGVTFAEATPTQAVDDWNFIGTYAAGSIPQGSYFFSNNKLKKATGDTSTIKPFRAYLTYTGTGNAPSITFNVDGETTSLRGISNEELVISNDDYYNLNGQRVNTPAKGVYIVNGKKVVIK